MSRYVVCVRTGFYLTADNTVSLEIGKRYEVVEPEHRDPPSMIRIIKCPVKPNVFSFGI